MKKLFKRYMFFMIALLILVILTFINIDLGKKAVGIVGFSFREMVLVIPPIFILLGLLDVWVPRETMVKFMGEKSGLKGILLSFFIGSAAAGPLYGAFPIAGVFMKKGVKFSNVLIFIGAWSTTKIPMFLFEITALGKEFAITRLLINIPSIVFISYILDKLVKPSEKEVLYEKMYSI